MTLRAALAGLWQEFRLQACLGLAVELVPATDVTLEKGGMMAHSPSPWLELRFAHRTPAGSWVKIAYEARYLDAATRPLIRFETDEGSSIEMMAMPLFGKAEWLGRIPDHCRRVLISPVNAPGPFAFAVTDCRPLFRAGLMPRALMNDTRTAFMAMGARCIQARQETRQALRFARGGTLLGAYPSWRRKHLRTFDPAGLDRPRTPAETGLHFHFLIDQQGDGATGEDSSLLNSLRAQPYPFWSCSILADATPRKEAIEAGTVETASPEGTLDTLLSRLPASVFLARLPVDTALPSHALHALAAHVARTVQPALVYGDEEFPAIGGGALSAVLKPDWSPILQAHSPYLGHAVFWSRAKLAERGALPLALFDSSSFRQCLLDAPATGVSHLRRILLTTSGPRAEAPSVPGPPLVPARRSARASVIIPNKDRLDLISAAVAGVLATEDHRDFNLVIVDNGSTAPEVLAFYHALRNKENVRIVECPGRFNYSRMCNLGAAALPADVHVFLNNDITLPHRQWLAPLVDWALRPEIGAVGARLLFPSGRIQHAGVVIGMGGFADHIHHNGAPDLAGEFNRLRVPHEVSAVTGACIAIEARKFDTVGGFDEVNLPVELNDIDLCMRLDAAGYKTLMCPQTELIHHQSASRGFSYRPFTRYRQERDYFQRRWGETLRDDRYFHPALSLFSTTPALNG